MSCSSTITVDGWLSRNCTEYAATQGQTFYNELFENFYPSGKLWIPGISESDNIDERLRFQHLLTDLCNTGSNGKYCREPLLDICSQYTREDLSNPLARQICGCYIPSSEYSEGIRACDPICSGFDTIKYHEANQNSFQTCQSTLCIIDNFTLIAKGSSVGDITFTQACPYCSAGGNCRCIIGDINIIASDSRLGALSLEQNCVGEIECYATVDGVRMPVDDCQSYIESFGLTTSVVEKQSNTYFIYTWAFLVFAVLVLILFLVGTRLLLSQKSRPEVIRIQKDISPSDLIGT